MYIFPSRQEREILVEATRTCVWSKLCLQHVCEICNTTARHKCRGLIYHQIKYFAQANNAFTIFLHRRHGRFIVYQFKTVYSFSNRDSKVTKRIPSVRRPRFPPSRLLLTRPGSIALNDRIKRAFPFHR